MSKLRQRSGPPALLVIGLTVGLGIVVTAILMRDTIAIPFLGNNHKLDSQLSQLKQEHQQGAISDSAVREQCLKLAADNPGTATEVASHLFLILTWPDTDDADIAREGLLQAAEHVDIGDWERELHNSRGVESGVRWWPLAGRLIERVRQQPDHPRAARLLCETAVLIRPTDAEISAPPELVEIAELIRERYASSPDIANFLEVVGNLGDPAGWTTEFESHVRHVLEVNQDRFVQCSAHFALASIVLSGGPQREEEAIELYERFIDRFDGETAYRAQSIEKIHRGDARRIVGTLLKLGLGKPAPATTGTDLEGEPMSLADFRGKAVLVSFWATTCGPCMRAIPHEKALVDRFGDERFAIVGVNCDDSLDAAREAVVEHGITWRSFVPQGANGRYITGDWHVGAIPAFFLLDPHGQIAGRWVGLPQTDEIEATIAELVGELP